MLLRHGRVYPKPTTWRQDHRRWLAGQHFEEPTSELVYLNLLAQVDALTGRKLQLAQQVAQLATDEPMVADGREVAILSSDRHAQRTVDPFLELGADWARFEKAPRVGAWLGLTPSLNQSGESRTQGSITKTGSTLARRLLVEAAWHYGPRPHVGPTLEARQHGQPEHVLQIANKAQHRLHRVYQQLKARGKPHGVVTVAVARELACFLWAAATAN